MTTMSGATKRTRPKASFPVRLHDMITHAETQGLQSVIGWVIGGRGFVIHDPDKLAEMLPLFFGKTKYKSFIRQLNMWDFDRISTGPNKGTHMHPYFVKGNRALCGQMNRQIKKKSPRAASSTRSPPQQQKRQLEKQQQIKSTSETELGTVKSEITECSRRLNKKVLDTVDGALPPSKRTGNDDEDIFQDDDNSFSSSATCSSTNTTNTKPNSSLAMRLVPPGVASEQGKQPQRDGDCAGASCLPKSSYSTFPSWLLPAALHSEAFLNTDPPERRPPPGGSNVSPIGEILDDFANLFEVEENEEEDRTKCSSALVLSAVKTMEKDEFLPSSPLMSCSSTYTDSGLADERKETTEESESYFAGKCFFSLDNEASQLRNANTNTPNPHPFNC